MWFHPFVVCMRYLRPLDVSRALLSEENEGGEGFVVLAWCQGISGNWCESAVSIELGELLCDGLFSPSADQMETGIKTKLLFWRIVDHKEMIDGFQVVW